MPCGRRHWLTPFLGGQYHWLSPLCAAWHPGCSAPGQMQAVGGLCLCPGISQCRAAEQINLLPQSLLPPGNLSLMSKPLWLGLQEALMLQSFALFLHSPHLLSCPRSEEGLPRPEQQKYPRACHQLCPWWRPSSGEPFWLGRKLNSMHPRDPPK